MNEYNSDNITDRIIRYLFGIRFINFFVDYLFTPFLTSKMSNPRIEKLLQIVTDINHQSFKVSRPNQDYSPLWMAAYQNQYRIAQLLIIRGDNINVSTPKKNSLLQCLIKDKRTKMARILIDNGANVNTVNSSGIPLLYDAVAAGDIKIIQALIAKDAKIDKASKNDLSNLLSVIRNNNLRKSIDTRTYYFYSIESANDLSSFPDLQDAIKTAKHEKNEHWWIDIPHYHALIPRSLIFNYVNKHIEENDGIFTPLSFYVLSNHWDDRHIGCKIDKWRTVSIYQSSNVDNTKQLRTQHSRRRFSSIFQKDKEGYLRMHVLRKNHRIKNRSSKFNFAATESTVNSSTSLPPEHATNSSRLQLK